MIRRIPCFTMANLCLICVPLPGSNRGKNQLLTPLTLFLISWACFFKVSCRFSKYLTLALKRCFLILSLYWYPIFSFFSHLIHHSSTYPCVAGNSRSRGVIAAFVMLSKCCTRKPLFYSFVWNLDLDGNDYRKIFSKGDWNMTKVNHQNYLFSIKS